MKILVTQRFWFFLWCVMLFMTMALLLRNRWLMAAAQGILLSLAIFLLFYVLAALSVTISRQRDFYHALDEEQLEVICQVYNRGLLPLLYTQFSDVFPADRAKRKEIWLHLLGPGASRQVNYTGCCERGRGLYHLGPLQITVSDPLGCFRIIRTLGVKGKVLVFPKITSLSEFPWRAGQGLRWFNATSQPLSGICTNFYGTREYQPGDNLRHIHWLSSARRGKLIIKEFERTTSPDVTILLDLAQQGLSGWGPNSNLEAAVRLAASLAAHANKQGCRFAFHADDGQMLYLPYGRGEAHLITLLHLLAKVQGQSNSPLTALLPRYLPLLPYGGSCWLIFLTVPTQPRMLLGSLESMLLKGLQPALFFFDEYTFPAVKNFKTKGPQRSDLFAYLDKAGFFYRLIAYRDDLAMVFKESRSSQRV